MDTGYIKSEIKDFQTMYESFKNDEIISRPEQIRIAGLFSDQNAFAKADKIEEEDTGYLIQRTICYNCLVPCDLYVYKNGSWVYYGKIDWNDLNIPILYL